MNRRETLRLLLLTAFGSKGFIRVPGLIAQESSFRSLWQNWPDMRWAGPEYWGNRLQDWSIRDGVLVCGVRAPNRMDDPEEVAHCMKTHWDLGLEGGLLIANPLPEEDALDQKLLRNVIEEALEEARKKQVLGKDITPFVLERIVEKTGGKSLDANIKLVQNNARLGARIASAFGKLKS